MAKLSNVLKFAKLSLKRAILFALLVLLFASLFL